MVAPLILATEEHSFEIPVVDLQQIGSAVIFVLVHVHFQVPGHNAVLQGRPDDPV